MYVRIAVLALGLLMAGPTPAAESAAAPLDAVAQAYVKLSLEIGERDPGYVDAYYGPAEWQAAAKTAPRELPALATAATALQQQLDAIAPASLSPLERRRQRFLHGQLVAARTRLAMLQGEKLSFADEAEGLFGVRPTLLPLSHYDAELDKIAALVPGDGPLWQRVDGALEQSAIPADKLEAVMHAAIAECRRRTAAHIALPADEKFTLELVRNQPWSGYNWYQGHANSLIQINVDLPVLMGRAVDLGCHEGYPGHHVLNTLLEQRLSRARGWVEFTVYPLYSPQSFIAEGSANYGIVLAFPGDEQLAFERKVLYPLAGMDPSQAARNYALAKAKSALAGARLTIAQQYLDGQIDRDQALALTQRYQLLSPVRAEQSLHFAEHYRSYVINYGLGEQQVQAHVEAAGKRPAARWRAMEAVLSEPTVPADLAPTQATTQAK